MARLGRLLPSTTRGSSAATASQLTSARRCLGVAARWVAQLATASSSISTTGPAPAGSIGGRVAALCPRPLRRRWSRRLRLAMR